MVTVHREWLWIPGGGRSRGNRSPIQIPVGDPELSLSQVPCQGGDQLIGGDILLRIPPSQGLHLGSTWPPQAQPLLLFLRSLKGSLSGLRMSLRGGLGRGGGILLEARVAQRATLR